MALTKVQPEMMQQLTPAIMPAGSVIQTVNGYYNTYTSTNSTSLVSTGLQATITPISTTSKILIFASAIGIYCSQSNNAANLQICRNGSSISYWDDVVGNGTASAQSYDTSVSYLDSPATTSAITYAIYWKRVGPGTGSIFINNYEATNGQTVSTITLMEIHG